MSRFNLTTIREQLSDSSRAVADITANSVYEKPALLEALFELSWADEEPWSMRASRVISICCCRFPELAHPYVSRIISGLPFQKSESARRNFLKIFADTELKLKNRDKASLLNSCFDFLTGIGPIAVKSYSMVILYRLTTDLPDIQKELYEIISNQVDEASPGFKSQALKILKKIEKQTSLRGAGSDADR